MIEKIILICFAIGYYLFSVFLVISYIQEEKKYSFLSALYNVLITMIAAPIGVPILLGIKIGLLLKEDKV